MIYKNKFNSINNNLMTLKNNTKNFYQNNKKIIN